MATTEMFPVASKAAVAVLDETRLLFTTLKEV